MEFMFKHLHELAIEWPYTTKIEHILHTEYICIKNVDVTEQNLHILSTFYSNVNLYTGCSMNGYDENIQKQMNEWMNITLHEFMTWQIYSNLKKLNALYLVQFCIL